MAPYRTSEVPQLPEFFRELPSRLMRESLVPWLTLVPRVAEAVALSAHKGEAKGVFHPGPALLPAGSRVGILCDTLYGDHEIGLDYAAGIQTGAELISKLGYEPVIDPIHAAVPAYFERWAGSIEQRVQHLVRLIEEQRVDAIFPLFGKGGSDDVVDALAATNYRPRRPIALIGGFSHHTDLSLFGQSARGRGFFSHQISTTQCAYWKLLPSANIDNLRAVLQGAVSVEYSGLRALNGHAAVFERSIAGVLTGGNMTALVDSADKTWMPELRGAIVYCEDYDRAGYDVHRGFSRLARLAETRGASAIVVGAMLPKKRVQPAKIDPERRRQQEQKDRDEVVSILSEVAARTQLPVFHHDGIASHGAMNYPLGFGAMTRIERDRSGGVVLFNELQVRS